MAAPTAAPRSRTPRNVSDSDDRVMVRAVEFAGWARTNARVIMAIAIVLLVVIGSLFYWRIEENRKAARAATEFIALEQTAGSGNTALATRDLQRYAQRFSGTVYADEARVLLARLQLQAGQPQQAVAALAGVADRIDDSPVGPQAALLLATAQQAANQPAAALDTYLRVSREAPLDYQKQEALAAAAGLREQTGDFAGAAELYRQLIATTDEGSAQRSLFEMRLAEAEGRALAR